MSDQSQPSNEPGDANPVARRAGRTSWQVGLRTLVLLMAAIAVWMTYFINRRHNAAVEARIKVMVPLAHELIVDDPKAIAVVQLEPYWFDDFRWDISLPDGQYRLCLATRGIDDDGFAPEVKSAPITSGRHQLAIDQQLRSDVWRVNVVWDGRELIAAEEPKDWDAGTGSMGGSQYSLSEQLSADKPAVLFRRRFMRRSDTGRDNISQRTDRRRFAVDRASGRESSLIRCSSRGQAVQGGVCPVNSSFIGQRGLRASFPS